LNELDLKELDENQPVSMNMGIRTCAGFPLFLRIPEALSRQNESTLKVPCLEGSMNAFAPIVRWRGTAITFWPSARYWPAAGNKLH
jgi:hypothetical protein